MWRNKNISVSTKLRIFETNVKAVLLYGAETRKHTKVTTSKLQVFINKCLRSILRIRWPDQITNKELWARCRQRPIEEELKDRKWRWIGHTLRKGQNNISCQALDWNPQGKRKRGRPRNTWKRTTEAELNNINISWKEVKTQAKDRKKWRTVVSALCSTRSEEE